MSVRHVVEVGAKGRLVVPARLRRQLGIEEGSELVALVENGALVLLTRDAIADRLHAMFAHVEGSLADELIAERRAEAAREDGDA